MKMIRANKDGIYKIQIYIKGYRCVSICGVNRRYSAKDGDILLSNFRFAKLVTAMISSDTNRFIAYVDSDDIAMDLKVKTVNVLRTELKKVKPTEVIKGGDKLSVYKNALKEAVENDSKMQLLVYAAS